MGSIRDELEKLEDKHLSYVTERSRVSSDADGYRNAGISKNTYYGWTNEVRDHLNDLAQRMKREAALKIHMILEEYAEEAAQVKVGGLRSRKEHIAQAASSEIMDRLAGKPTQHQQVEVSGQGGGPIVLRWPEEMDDD
jgi:predicted DNA-binding protein